MQDPYSARSFAVLSIINILSQVNFQKKIFESMAYSKEKIKDFSGNVLKNGYEKIKDIANSETVKNIKSACEDISNSILDSKLSEEEKNKIKNKKDNLLSRLKRQ